MRGRKLPVKCPEGTRKGGWSNIWGEMYKHLCENVVFLALTRQKTMAWKVGMDHESLSNKGPAPRQNSPSQSTQTSRQIVKNKNPRGKTMSGKLRVFSSFPPFFLGHAFHNNAFRLKNKTKLQLSLLLYLGGGREFPISPFGRRFGGFRNWNDREDFFPLFENFP